MKRVLVLLLLGLLVLTGCSPEASSSKGGTTTSSKPADTSKPKGPPADPG